MLSRRSATVGNTITVNTQKHGEEDVTALYIPLSSLGITAEELPEVCLEPKAYKLLFRKWKGRPDEPIWGKLAPVMSLNGKVKGVSATLFLGRRQLKVTDAVIAKMRLEPETGGVSKLSFQLQCCPDLDENHPIMETLLSKVNQAIDVEIEAPHYGAQPDLPLEEPEDDEEEEAEDVETEEDSRFAHIGPRAKNLS